MSQSLLVLTQSHPMLVRDLRRKHFHVVTASHLSFRWCHWPEEIGDWRVGSCTCSQRQATCMERAVTALWLLPSWRLTSASWPVQSACMCVVPGTEGGSFDLGNRSSWCAPPLVVFAACSPREGTQKGHLVRSWGTRGGIEMSASKKPKPRSSALQKRRSEQA